MRATFVAAALVAGAATIAEAKCPGAFMGLKGKQYDIDGYDASGYDVFGFNRNGVDRWNRPCSDPNAGLTPAGGRFLTASHAETPAPAPTVAPPAPAKVCHLPLRMLECAHPYPSLPCANA